MVGTDRELAAPFVPSARKLLGMVVEEAGFNKLKHHTRRQVLPDGTVLSATVAGEIYSVEIDVRKSVRRPRRPRQDRDDFVLWARNASDSRGINTDFPQQIVAPAVDPADWKTFTYYPAPPVGRSDGAYKVNFVDGVKQAGNIDWTDGKVRINYYGPSRRYWYDGWRKPDKQYSTFVFLNGVVLLNTLDHGAAAQKYVLGAALVRDKLYVMQAAIADFRTDYDTMYPAPRTHSWVSPPYPDGDVELRLCRYTVKENTETTKNGQYYKVAPGSLETLWTDTRRGYVNPWFFNPDATACETFAMPDELRRVYSADNVPVEGSAAAELLRPSDSSENMTLAITPLGVTASVVDVSIPAYASPGTSGFPAEYVAEVEIAADYAADGTRRALIYRHVAQAFPVFENYREYHTLRVVKTPALPEDPPPGELQVHLNLQRAFGNVYGELEFEQRALLFADLRIGALATYRMARFTDISDYLFYRDVEVHLDGSLAYSARVPCPTYVAHTPIGITSNQRGRGFNRAQGVWAYWNVIRTGRTAVAPNVSPMVLVAGVGIDTTARRATPSNVSTRYVEDTWVTPGIALPPYLFPDDELEAKMVFPALYRQTIGAASTATAMLPFTNVQTTLRGLSNVHDAAHPYFRTDGNGMRIMQSVAQDSAGRLLASLTVPFAAHRTRTSGAATADNPDTNFYRTTVGVSFSSGDPVSDLTGVDSAPGGLSYANPVPNVYDARYTPIWLLGEWPEIAPPEPEA